jgi:high-affinity K+ transport system ATPase subunit B
MSTGCTGPKSGICGMLHCIVAMLCCVPHLTACADPQLSVHICPQVDTVVFDKTGTLTAGRPVVAGITMLSQHDSPAAPSADHSSQLPHQANSSSSSSSSDSMSPSLMLQLAAAVERQATHPVAKALVAAAAADRNAAAAASSSSSSDASEQQQLLQERRDSHAAAGTSSSSSRGADSEQHHFWQHPASSSKGSGSGFSLSASAAALLESGRLLEPESGTFRQEPGSGAVAVVSGHKVSVGTLEWVQRHGAQLGQAAEQVLSNSTTTSSSSSPNEPLTGHTQVYVGVDGMVVGLVDVADVIRPDARSTVRELHEQGIKTIMLSGAHGWSGMQDWHRRTPVVLEHTPGQCSQYMVHGMNFLAVGMHVPNPCVTVQSPCWHTQWHWLVVMRNIVSDTEWLAVLLCCCTGDRQEAAVKVAAAVGISPSDVHAGIKPAGKLAHAAWVLLK